MHALYGYLEFWNVVFRSLANNMLGEVSIGIYVYSEQYYGIFYVHTYYTRTNSLKFGEEDQMCMQLKCTYTLVATLQKFHRIPKPYV